MKLVIPRAEILPNYLVVRADASKDIGAGHVVRCLTLSRELAKRGFLCIFLEDYIKVEWLRDQIRDSGFSLCSLKELGQMKLNKPILLIDSYEVTLKDANAAPVGWKAIVQIIDPETTVLPASLYISPNPYSDIRLTEVSAPVFEGIDFIPIREKFLQRQEITGAEGTPLNFLVSGGGSNVNGFVEVVCSYLRNFSIDFRVTALTSSKEILEWDDARFSTCNLGNLDSLNMTNFNFFLTTSGQSAWEFLATGGLIGVASGIANQSDNYKYLVDSGAAMDLGAFNSGAWELRIESLDKLILGEMKIQSNAFHLQHPGFGKGASRIADKIQGLLSFEQAL